MKDYTSKLMVPKKRLELADTIDFENILKDRANELNSKLKESSNIRESIS
jgi:hypothetical protein